MFLSNFKLDTTKNRASLSLMWWLFYGESSQSAEIAYKLLSYAHLPQRAAHYFQWDFIGSHEAYSQYSTF